MKLPSIAILPALLVGIEVFGHTWRANSENYLCRVDAAPQQDQMPASTQRRIQPLEPRHFEWQAPEPTRAPCPFLNTMANHGFLPHNGRNITREIFLEGVIAGVNMDVGMANGLFTTGGQVASPDRSDDPMSFDLGMIHVKDFLEHDGSLSRVDTAIDQSNRFSPDTFNNFVKYLGDATEIDPQLGTEARAQHVSDMSKLHPGFGITRNQHPVILTELATQIVLWGTPGRPVANREFLEYFFRHERLPVELGWQPSEEPFGPNVDPVVGEMLKFAPDDVPIYYNPGKPNMC